VLLQARTIPADDHDLVDYLLDTEAMEMDFEVARCRPRLTPDFFKLLDRNIGVAGDGCCHVAAVGQWCGVAPSSGRDRGLFFTFSSTDLWP
jgi:hypothetical protein